MSAPKVDVLAVMRVAAKRLRVPGVEGLPAGPLTADEVDMACDAVAELVACARKAQDTNSDGYVLGRPDVSHLGEAERAAFLRGWDAASEAVYRTGLRAALAAFEAKQ